LKIWVSNMMPPKEPIRIALGEKYFV
jgi:hypothetical protein